MPICRTLGTALLGIDAVVVDVEVDARPHGLPGVHTVGLPDAAVRESEDRVRAAIHNSDYGFPGGRLTVNLAPADLRKVGSRLDVAVAVAILGIGGTMKRADVGDHLLLGELSLDGRLRPVPGALPAALMARRRGIGALIVPPGNAAEASAVEGVQALPAKRLRDVIDHLNGVAPLCPHPRTGFRDEPAGEQVDLRDVRGQPTARRALEVAAAGGHNLLLIGPPGTGKTMLARRLPTILPPLDDAGAVEAACVRSAAGDPQLRAGISRRPPFRAPHHSVSVAGLVGGGALPRPGEISLAHRGVLFLDEMPEFPRASLEALRQPLEDGRIRVCRAQRTLTFPAAFALVAAMNPCPCGFRGEDRCRCEPIQLARYRARLSGPVLDRIDLHVEVPALGCRELLHAPPGEPSAAVRERVLGARAIQDERFQSSGAAPRGRRPPAYAPCNARVIHRDLQRWCRLDDAGRTRLAVAVEQLHLSARAHDRVLRVARTVADLDGADSVASRHLSEAIHYRSLDRPLA